MIHVRLGRSRFSAETNRAKFSKFRFPLGNSQSESSFPWSWGQSLVRRWIGRRFFSVESFNSKLTRITSRVQSVGQNTRIDFVIPNSPFGIVVVEDNRDCNPTFGFSREQFQSSCRSFDRNVLIAKIWQPNTKLQKWRPSLSVEKEEVWQWRSFSFEKVSGFIT